jgi:hypothetical protein
VRGLNILKFSCSSPPPSPPISHVITRPIALYCLLNCVPGTGNTCLTRMNSSLMAGLWGAKHIVKFWLGTIRIVEYILVLIYSSKINFNLGHFFVLAVFTSHLPWHPSPHFQLFLYSISSYLCLFNPLYLRGPIFEF